MTRLVMMINCTDGWTTICSPKFVWETY